MLLQPIFEGSEDDPPALGFGCAVQGDRVRVHTLWVGVQFNCSSVTARLYKNENDFSTLELEWISFGPGVHEEVFFNVIQD